MPVPFPTADTVKLDRPDAEEVRVMVGGVAAAIAPDGQLTGLQKLLVEAMTESMTGFVVPAGHVPRLDPEQFARAMANRDANFRQRMLQFMLLGSLVLVPLPDEVIRRVEAYADELGVQNDMLRIAHRFSKGSLGLALIDFERSGYMQKWAEEHKNPLHTSGELEQAWQQCSRDPELVARWEALRALPDGTLGREVAKFYDARGFGFPGSPGSAPPLLAQHDWLHVVGDYGSTVECELEVFAFISRANDDPRAFSLLAMVISLFETGYMATGAGLFEYDRGHLSHEGMAVRLADAMRRGALCAAHANSPDFLAHDWFAEAHRPVDELRAEFGVVSKSERAIEVGSVTPWQPGGISPYQYDCGQKAAADAGREYDSYGAVPATA
jgi:hypothetical protein